MPDASGRRDHRRRQVRAQRDRRAYRAGHCDRNLTVKAGRMSLKVPKLKGAVFSSAVIERCRRREEGARGGFGRHVPGRRGHAAGRRRQPAIMGRPHALADIERQAQEGVLRHRRMAGASVGTGVSVCVHGWRMAQALLGRRRGERERAGGHRRRHGRPQGGARRRGGHEGGRRKLARIHQGHARTRPQGREAGDGRPARRPRGGCGRIAARGALSAAHGALRTQRARQGQPREPGLGRGRPEGRVLHGNQGQGVGEGRIRRQGHGGAEARGGRQMPSRGHRRDDDPLARRLSPRA
ncbi:Uncharacterised protein [Bifidobacterium breve]|nr:Uncharacterised protein [Bifidobacterium breve]